MNRSGGHSMTKACGAALFIWCVRFYGRCDEKAASQAFWAPGADFRRHGFMKVTVNGEPLELEKSINLTEFAGKLPSSLIMSRCSSTGNSWIIPALIRRLSRTAIRWNSCISWEAVQDEQPYE